MTILEAYGLTIDLWRVYDIYDALDARSQDYANFIPMFGERGSYGQLELAAHIGFLASFFTFSPAFLADRRKSARSKTSEVVGNHVG